MTSELEQAIGAVLDAANRKFDAAIAALQPRPTEPPMTFAEALGAIVRGFHESLRTFGIEYRRGYNRPYTPPHIAPYTIHDPNPNKIITIPGSHL